MTRWQRTLCWLVFVLGLLGLLCQEVGSAPRDAARPRDCPYRMGEPCPKHYGKELCATLVYDLATSVDVSDIDFLLHSAGCDQRPDGRWAKRTNTALDPASDKCSRRAYWLVNRGYSILWTREKLATNGCHQYEDGTYYFQA